MAYRRLSWYFKESIEHEIKWEGKYGAKGEKRAKRKKATPEQIKRQNQSNRIKNMRRLIKKNFEPGDYWCALKYPEGLRKSVPEYKRDMLNFLTKCRRWWKKRGVPFKFIYRMEIGKLGGTHFHILVNRIPSETGQPTTDQLLQMAWTHGVVNYENTYKKGWFENLAYYIVKMPDEDGQICMFDEDIRKEYIKYSSSRNLIRPEPEVKEYKRRTIKSIALDPPEATDGYYVDKSSIKQGINPYTGLSYCHYIEYKKTVPWEGG